MKYLRFGIDATMPHKRYLFILENVLVNGRSLFIHKLLGSFSQTTFLESSLQRGASSFFLGSGFQFFSSRRLLYSQLLKIMKKYEDAKQLKLVLLKLVGTGYKALTPRKFNRRSLFLRVGFAASELKYSLVNPNIKIRARKQKIVLFGFNRNKITQTVNQIINLRYPNVYNGKGIRKSTAILVNKVRKQQQRSK